METNPVKKSIVYSVPVTNPDEAVGETPVYRHPESVHNLITHIKRLPQVKNLQDLHLYNSKEFKDLNCLGSREKLPDGSLGQYQFKTYQKSYETATQAGSAIVNLGLAPLVKHEGYPDTRPIVLYEKSCEPWVLLDMASCLYGLTIIPIFDALGLEALQYIFNQTSATTIFTSGPNVDTLISDGSQGKLFHMKTIVCLQGYTQSQKEAATNGNLQLLSWEEFLLHGEKTVPYPELTPETIFTLGYTSGTTGLPKGAIITHANIVNAIAGCEEAEGLDSAKISKGSIHLSYLPLAHIFERVFMEMILCRGVTVGFYGGNPLKLTEDLQLLKPTHLTSVPRLYNKFYNGLVGMMKKFAPDSNLPPLETLEKLPPQARAQMKMLTGGNVEMYVTGSAPISPDVLKFLRAAFQAPISEGFGQTETCSAIFLQHPDDTSLGNIGGVFKNLEFKLVDVPEMNYTSKDKDTDGQPLPRGELCLRGGPIFKGYYREPEKTAESIDEKGWHHTGDVAALLPNGAIKLIDRRKNIFKLAQGEYVAPEKIENIYLTNKYVTEVYVYGDSFQSEVVAIIVPDKDNLMGLGKELGFENLNFEELCKEPRVVKRVTEEINETAQNAKLIKYELAQNIYLEPRSFALSGLTTPSMKLKRNIAKQYYEAILAKLCNAIDGNLKN